MKPFALIFLLMISLSACSPLLSINEMDFWAKKAYKPNDLILTAQQISALNNQIKTQQQSAVCSLLLFPSEIDQMPYFNQIEPIIENLSTMFDGNNKLTAQQISIIRNNANISSPSLIPVEYAISACRTEVRLLPTSKKYYTEPNDFEFDGIICSVLLPYEPVVIIGKSSDGMWTLIQSGNICGYVQISDLIILAKDQWSIYVEPKEYLTVIADKLNIDGLPTLYMGTIIPIDSIGNALIPQTNDVISIAARTLKHNKIIKGSLPYTAINILSQAFCMIENRYGWGGSFGERDCSSFINDIYKCFGISIGRNSKNQLYSGSQLINLSEMEEYAKKQAICALPIGSILYFPGHVMLYIGDIDGDPYIIHAIYAHGDKQIINADGSLGRVIINRVAVTNCNLLRAKDGKTFLDSFTHAVVF